MTATPWFDTLVSVGAQQYVINGPGHHHAPDPVFGGDGGVTYAYGDVATSFDINKAFGAPEEVYENGAAGCCVAHAFELAFIIWNSPYDEFEWTGAATCPVGHYGPTTTPFNGQGPGTAGWGASSSKSGWLSQVFAGVQSFGLRVDWDAVLSRFGPDAGLGVPEVPTGYVLEWEHPEPEVVVCQVAPDEPIDASGNTGVVHWYHHDGGFGPNHDPEVGRWTLGESWEGFSVGYYPGGLSEWSDVPLPLFGQVAASPPYQSLAIETFVCRGESLEPVSGPNESKGEQRFSQRLAVRISLRARRYRFVTQETPPIRLYPRDDGLGHSSARRLYPPVKATRIVGGYQ